MDGCLGCSNTLPSRLDEHATLRPAPILHPLGGFDLTGRMAVLIAVNLRVPLELLQALLPGMAQRGWGRVLAIGSTQQPRPSPVKLVYAATKAAPQNWVLNLARQLGSRGITVNNLVPGVIATARNQAQRAAEGAELVQRIPVGRIGMPEDLVGAALLLCSDAGRYITGADLYVDGGRHIA